MCVCVCVFVCVCLHVPITLALRQLSGPLPSRLAGSALAALQLVALFAGVSHLGAKVLVRQLSLAVGGGAWISTGHNYR